MSEKTTLEVLREARELLSDEKRWTRNVFCRTADPSRVGWDHLTDPDVVSWCMEGALYRAADMEPEDVRAAGKRLLRATSRGGSLPGFNDAEATTHADVLAAFDRAIAAEESKS